MKHKYFDIHTHNPNAYDAIINVEPGFTPEEGKFYSVGIHPWSSNEPISAYRLSALDGDASHPQVLAIGETGIDHLKGGPLERQIELLRHHIDLSEKLGKPLILHAVKAYPEIIKLKKDINPRQPWIIHGFRGKPELAEELVRHGFYLSLGAKFNPQVPERVPVDHILAETDESAEPVDSIASRIPGLDYSLPRTLFMR